MIKVAIIAPVPLLREYASKSDDYHLLLSNLLHHREYRDFYRERKDAGDFLLLDNSAHELGHGEGFASLTKMLDTLPVDEVVVPDRLFFGEDTVENAREFIPHFRDQYGTSIGLVGVPQGRIIDEWNACAEELLELGVDTIGISKDYENWPGGLLGRAELIHSLCQKAQLNLPIHMLGWGRESLQVESFVSFNYNNKDEEFKATIRGIDSAKPLVYAEAGVDLMPLLSGTEIRYPKRPSKFFDLIDDDIPTQMAHRNIDVFKQLVQR